MDNHADFNIALRLEENETLMGIEERLDTIQEELKINYSARDESDEIMKSE
jgi:hypothetical protein